MSAPSVTWPSYLRMLLCMLLWRSLWTAVSLRCPLLMLPVPHSSYRTPTPTPPPAIPSSPPPLSPYRSSGRALLQV